MNKKKWLLLFIIALPSLFWIILETSSINSYRLNYYGPKGFDGKDSVFYKVNAEFCIYDKATDTIRELSIATNEHPFYAIMFMKNEYEKEGYRSAGLTEYVLYKKDPIKEIPFFIVSSYNGEQNKIERDLEKLSNEGNVKFICLEKNRFDSVNALYFKDKPYYVDQGFFVLVDHNRNIRGYYDSRYAMEIKRLSDEYKHLRLKSEKEKMLKENEIKKKN